MQPITLEDLQKIVPGTIFASGTTINSPAGIYMTDERVGDALVWIAKKGHGNDDWCIYMAFAPTTDDYISKYGQKVSNKENIKKLVSCTEEVYNRYRH